jgi:peptide/nickel transport system permease protein
MAQRLVVPASPNKVRWVIPLRRLFKNSLVVFATTTLLIFILLAVFAPLVVQRSPRDISYTDITQPPSTSYWFGSDDLGRDVYARVVYGARVSLGIGFMSVLIAAVLGTSIGVISGYIGGWFDEVVMRLVDALLALPFLVLAIVVAAALGASLQNIVLAISIVSLPGFARIARGETLAIKEQDYIQAANALGSNSRRVMLRHLLPNILGPLIVQATLATAQAILTESSLSFLGLGIQPPTPAWGSMLNTAKGYLNIAPWMALFPGSAIFLVVLSLSLLGDGLRSFFNPSS